MHHDVIAAIATAPGLGAVAIVRLSGHGTFEVAARVAVGFNPDAPRRARLLTLRNARGEAIDEALVTAFITPHSFTGDDQVEFATHGGAMVPAQVLSACLEAGARMALPGEFTRRAVFNGRLDLIQAEAVGDLVAATAPAQTRIALRQLDGGLSTRIAGLRESLLQCEALLAYAIDFPEEDDGPIDPTRIVNAVHDISHQMQSLLETAGEGERVRRGALVVLAGLPNAGKSSLFNALLGRERAMVTEIPGTTRDAIEGDVSIDGWPIRLVDTAGLRESEDRLESMGIEVSHRYLAEADLILFCREGELGNSGVGEFGNTPVIVVITKVDLVSEGFSRGGAESPRKMEAAVSTSAQTGNGLAALRSLLVEKLFGIARTSRGDEAMLTSVRQRLSVNAAAVEVSEALVELHNDQPVLAAHRLRNAVVALDELIGVVDREEVFDRVFSGFCVGK